MALVERCRVAVVVVAWAVLGVLPARAATFQSVGSGDWNNGGTWNQAGATPTSGDAVQIMDGHTVTVTSSADVANTVTFVPSSLTTTLQINAGAKLQVTGNVTIADGGFADATLNVGDGTLVVGGNILIEEGVNGGVGRLIIGSGGASCQNLQITTSAAADTRIEFTNAGLLSMKGTMSSSGTLVNSTAGAGSTVKFDGSTTQTIGSYTYQNLQIANTGVNPVETVGAITVNGTLAINTGIFLVKNSFSAGPTAALTMAGSTYLKLGDATTTFNVSLPTFASYTLGSGTTIHYGANANQTINFDPPYQNLDVAYTGSVGSITKQFVSNMTIAGNLNVDQQAPGSVTLDVGAGLVTVGGTLMGDGGIAFPSGGTLALAGDFNNTGTFSAGTGTMQYDGGQFQNTRNAAYNNLIITGTNTNASVGTTGGSAATLTVDANAFFDLNNNFTVSGAVVVNGTVNSTGDTLFLGASASTIDGSGAIYAHVSSSTRTIAAASSLDFNGNFTIASASTVTNLGTTTILNSLAGTDGTSQWINGANSTLYVGGFVMTSGTLDASANPNAVYYNGGNQTVKEGTYHDLVLTSTIPAAKTFSATPVTINNDFVVSGNTTATAGANLDINNDVTIGGPSAVFDAGSFAHTIAGEWTIGGTFTPSTSTITFDGTAQSLTASPFYKVSFSTGAKTLGGNLDVANDFDIGSTATVSAGSTTINVAGSWTQASGGTFTPGTSNVVFDGTGAQSIDATTFHTLTVNKSTGQVTLSGNVSAAQLDLFGGDLLVGSNTLDVNGDVTLNSGTFDLGTGTTNVSGHLATNSTMTATTAWLIIDGTTGIQNWTGTTAPALHNLEINKPSASLNPTLNLNVSGFLQLTSGDIVTTGEVSVTSGQIIHTSGYVDGRLNVTHSTNGAKLYPLGTASGYAPVTVTIANPGQLDLEIFNAPQPNNTNANADLLQIYWTIHPTTVTGNVDLQFEWPVAAVNGTESAYILGRYSGGTWTQPTSTVNDVTHTGTATGVSAFTGDWTAGGPAAVGAISDLEITSDGNAVAGVGETITITAKNAVNATVTSYSGFHTLVFSGPSTSPGGNVPTVLDKDLNAQDVGNNTVLNFVNGVATTTATFYTDEFASIDATEGALTGTTHGVNVDSAAASTLAFTAINSGNPLYATVPFSLTVTAQDAYGNASAVVANTQVDVTCGTCTGNLAGTLTQTITSGTDSAGFSGLTYDTAEAGVVFNAAATAGDALSGTSTAGLTFTAQAAGYTVTTNADSGAGSLRDAIAAVNSGACGTPCNITFDILPAGAYTFALATRLPAINYPVVIDGETQDGYAGTPLLTLDNAGIAGLELSGGSSTVRGFVIKNFSGGTGIILNSDNNVVQNCWIGVLETGLTAAGNSIGVEVYGNNNLIGGSVVTARNIISGNTAIGVSIGSNGSGNTVSGNYIGTDKNGSAAIGNAIGVLIGDTATGTTIGGATVAHRNVIAGSTGDGIQVQGAAGDVTNTAIKNNHIGVAADGTTTLGNVTGIHLLSDVDGVFIGLAGEGNVIGGNDFAIGLDAVTVQNISIAGNRIGVAADGTTNIGNTSGAIVINGPSGTVIEQNVIANNGGAGVNILAGDANTILDNTIRDFGTQAIDLGGDGIDTIDATDPDAGPNGHQNAPTIASAAINGSNLDVTLSIDSSATSAASLFIEVYESDANGALGTLLGTTCFANDVFTNGIMSVPLGAVAAGDKIVATATSYTDLGCGSIGDGTSEVSAAATAACVPITVTITGASSMCAGGSITLDAGAGYTGYLWSTGATSQTINVTTGGTYSVTVTAANGCTGTDSHIVTVNPNPTVNISGPASACDSAILDAGTGFTSYLWSTGAITQTITVTTGGTYTVTVQNGSGCSASDTHTIAVNTSPTATITGPSTACDSAVLNAGAGFASYLWSNGATTQTTTVTATGTYSVTVTDSNGCSGSDTHAVTITTTPGNSITPSGPTTFCAGGSVTLTASPAASYLWSTGATTSSIVVTAAGSYSVQTTNGTCTATSASVPVTVNPNPTPVITGPSTACDSAILDAGSGYASYLWSNGDTTQTTTVTTTGTYSVTVTDGNGCSGSDTHAVTITTTPGNTVTPSGPTTFCAGGSVTLTASPAASYLWSTGDTTSSIVVTAAGSYSVQTTNGTCTATSAPVAVTVNPNPAPVITGPASACDSAVLDAGPGFASYLWSTGATTQTITVTTGGTYSVTVTNGSGCSGGDSHTIAINSSLTPVITGPASACAPSTVTLDAGTGFTSYLWSTGATTQTVAVSATGTYSVTVTGAGGCTGSDSHNVTIFPAATATITAGGPTSFCTGGSVVLSANAGSSYLWSTGATTQSITVTASGSYSVTVTDGNGCGATSAPATVTVNPVPSVTITGPAATCIASPVTLDAGPGFASYLWSTGATTQTITVSPAVDTTYSVTVSSGAGCTASDSHTVTVDSNPVASITVPAGVCSNSTGNNASVPFQAGATYLWTVGNGTITGGQGTSAIVFTAGASGSVTVGITMTNGTCTSTGNEIVPISPVPSSAITAPATLEASSTGNAASVPSTAGATYSWGIVNGAITGGLGTNAITFTAGASGTTKLTITVDVNGCSSSNLKIMSINGPAPTGSDLAITKSAPASAAVSSALTYTLVATNNGPQSVSDVVINDPLPFGTTFVSVDGGSFGCGHSAGVVLCNGALPAGVSVTIAINVTTPSTAGLIVNNATIESSSTDDADPSNNGASAATNVFSNGNCPTGAPQLTAPAATSTTSSPVTFSWTPVPQAIGYRLWFEANGTGPQEGGTTDGAIMLTVNVPPGVIVAYVDALFSGCPERRSAAITFNVSQPDPCGPRATPVALAPASGATVNTSEITFQWTAAIGADGYRVWVAVNGGTPAVLGTTTDETSLTGNAGPGTITWWAEALYEGCASTESQHLTFNVPARNDCPAQTPAALSPANGTTVTNGDVTFQWSAVPDAREYEVWLSVANGTHTLIGVTDGTSLQALVAEGTLDWFVRAIVDRCAPLDSQHARFAYDAPDACAANQRPILISPLPGQAVTSPADFAWTNVGASSYQLFLIRGNAPPQLMATTTTPFRNGLELNGGRMRWFVRALFGNCSPLDSADQKLEVVPEPQACAALVPPIVGAAGQISSGVPFLVQWNEVPGATSYELQIASNAAFSDAELVTTEKHHHQLTRTNDGDAPLPVFVRVRAIDARCTPEPTITPFGPTAAIFILPVDGIEGSAPVDGGTVTHTIHLGPELAGQTFTATVKEPWLTVAPANGVVAPGGTNLTVTATLASLPLGTTLGAVRIELSTPGSGNVASQATTLNIPTVSITKVTPVLPTPKSGPPPDALIIPAVAHADGVNSKFQSDVRVTNSSAQLINYQLTFTPTGGAGITTGRQTTFSIDPGRTIALDDILKSWFGTGGESVTGTLEVRPLTQTASSTSSAALSGLPNLSTFASSRTFNKTLNGTFGQYIPAIPFANFIDRDKVLSLQQIAQSTRYRTNLGIVEGSGSPANLLVKVFGSSGQKLTEFPVQLAGGQHTQLNSFLVAQGVGNLTDGRIEIAVTSGAGKVTAYASVLDNETSDPLLVTPVTLGDGGATKWVIPGVADLDNGTANWQTDMRVFNAGTTDVDATLLFYSQNGGEPRSVTVPIAAGQVRQFDRALANTFGATSDGGAVHITTAAASKLITTARTYNLTSTGTYGQFISGVTTSEAAGVGSRPLQLLQIEESNRFRTNVGLAEVTGNPVKLEIAIVPPDAKFTAVTEVQLGANEFRQLNSVLRSAGFADSYNVRVTVRAVEGNGRVTAYASVIDMLTNDPTYVPAQ